MKGSWSPCYETTKTTQRRSCCPQVSNEKHKQKRKKPLEWSFHSIEMTLGSSPVFSQVGDTTPMGFSRTLPGIWGSGIEGEYSRMLLLPTNQHRKPEKFNRELQEKSWLNKTPQDLMSQKDMKWSQGTVTAELWCEGSQPSKNKIWTPPWAALCSVCRESEHS